MKKFTENPNTRLLIALGGVVVLTYIIGIPLEGIWGLHSLIFLAFMGFVMPEKARPLTTTVAIFFCLFSVVDERYHAAGFLLLLALACAGSTIMNQASEYRIFTLPLLVLAAASYVMNGGGSLNSPNWIAYSFFAFAISASLRKPNST